MPRGTLQTMFQQKAFDELRRLGLTPESERIARSSRPEQTGMLVVEQVIPDSAADGKLAPGDILIRINGKLVTEFMPLGALLDSHVGQEIDIELERGGRQVMAKVLVDDLHAITPDEYIEFGDGDRQQAVVPAGASLQPCCRGNLCGQSRLPVVEVRNSARRRYYRGGRRSRAGPR